MMKKQCDIGEQMEFSTSALTLTAANGIYIKLKEKKRNTN